MAGQRADADIGFELVGSVDHRLDAIQAWLDSQSAASYGGGESLLPFRESDLFDLVIAFGVRCSKLPLPFVICV